jgi:hypothetical protein
MADKPSPITVAARNQLVGKTSIFRDFRGLRKTSMTSGELPAEIGPPAGELIVHGAAAIQNANHGKNSIRSDIIRNSSGRSAAW